MRKLHRTVFTLAGLALAAGTVLGASPAGAATTALMDFPSQFSEGTIVNVHSGKCLEPSPDDPFGNGDIVEQHTCNGTLAQTWQLVLIGTRTFVNAIPAGGQNPPLTHLAYRIVNAESGLCLDDRDGVLHNGAIVQLWACNTGSTTMQWGGFLDANGRNLIANVRASIFRSELMTLEIAAGSTADNAPVQLFNGPRSAPAAAQEWVYNPAS